MEQHLEILEQEAIELIREVITTNNLRDVWSFYSTGKDSSVMYHIITKAFYPRPVNIKFLHIDMRNESPKVYELRDRFAKDNDLMVYAIPDKYDPAGVDCAAVVKKQSMMYAIAEYDIKVVFDGSRREERGAHSNENMVMVEGKNRAGNTEINKLWNTLCSKDSTLYVFPLSDWTESDIWEYVLAEKIEVAPMYFPHGRNVTEKGRLLLPALPKEGGLRHMRTHTLGCYPMAAAIESEAGSSKDIIAESQL